MTTLTIYAPGTRDEPILIVGPRGERWYLGPYADDTAATAAATALPGGLQNGYVYLNTTTGKTRVRKSGAWANNDADAQDAVTAAQLAETNAETAEANAETAQAAAESARDAAATSATAAAAIVNGVSGTYATKAAATAAIASIAANAFVQVIADETHGGHRTLYQKQSGSLVFILDFDVGRFIYPETYGAVPYSTRATAEVGTDSSAAFAAAITAWYTTGGTLFLSGWYRVTTAFLLPNTNTSTTIGSQPPLRITGIGGHGNGRGIQANYGAGLVWTAETGAAVAKIDTRGAGILVLDNCTFASKAGSGNTKPFVHTTYTTVQTGTGFCLDGAVYGASAAEDGFVLGGTYDHETDALFDRTSSDAGFQGYGTVIQNVYCNGIKRLAVLQRYANAVRIQNNTLWSTCGNNSATGGAIELNGAPVSPTTFAVGAVIQNNLIEVTYYKYGVHAKNAAHGLIAGNDAYDATGTTLAAVFVDSSCQNMKVIASLAPTGLPYLIDSGSVCKVFGSEVGQYDVSSSIRAGVAGYPNLFGATTFTGGTNNTVIKPATAIVNTAFLKMTTSSLDTTPDTDVFTFNGNGSIALGNFAGSGNISNALPSGASWSNNGRKWGFTSLTGSNMEINSGTGGSILTLQNFAVLFKDHTGTVQAKLWSSAASGLGNGIDFGSAGDASIYRPASAAVLAVNVPLRLKSYTVATLLAAATAGAGAVAYVTDLNATTAGSVAAGGGSNKGQVICDGTNWRIVVAWA